jgi:hypothetical protein
MLTLHLFTIHQSINNAKIKKNKLKQTNLIINIQAPKGTNLNHK